jgi:hypothetical protein
MNCLRRWSYAACGSAYDRLVALSWSAAARLMPGRVARQPLSKR